MEMLRQFFATDGFMPHGMCLLWRPGIFWLHAIADSIIALSYYSIPIALIFFIRRRSDIAFPWVFQMFGAFILACGTTHVLAVWTLWHPDYVVEGLVKAATAALSVGTAALLWPLMPRALALPSTSQLETANRELTREVGVRQEAEAAVRRLNEDLEMRVAQRAADLAKRELIYRTVIETALDAFILMDDAGAVVEWNPQAEQMFGWSAAEAVGRRVVDLIIPAALRDAHLGGLTRFLESQEAKMLQRRVEVIALRRDGKEFPAELMIVPFKIGERWSFSGFVRDLSAQRQGEEQLRQAQKMEAVGQLTGGMAHDFNNLLTAMITSLDLLSEKVEPQSQNHQLAQLALNAALRGAELTRHLLAFSRRQKLEAQAMDLNKVVADTTEFLRRTLGEQVVVEMRLADDLAPAMADPAQVSSALANLAINARDAMPGGGGLILETANKYLDADYVANNLEVEEGDYVMLAVSDSGVGIPADVLARVFEPFFSTKSAGKGSGLGLSMVYGFAKQSGGHLKIYSEVGHGTTVRLYLPRADRSVDADEDRSAPSFALQSGATILVVEDDPDVRKGVMTQLASLGHDAIETVNGAQALGVLKQDRRIDLLFTDVVMPGMSGIDLAHAAHDIRPGLKILFTSGFAETAPQNGVLAKRNLLSKPYRLKELAQKIRDALTEGEA